MASRWPRVVFCADVVFPVDVLILLPFFLFSPLLLIFLPAILPLLLACTILLFTLGVATLVTVVNIYIRDAALRLFGGSGIVLAVIIGLDAARTV